VALRQITLTTCYDIVASGCKIPVDFRLTESSALQLQQPVQVYMCFCVTAGSGRLCRPESFVDEQFGAVGKEGDRKMLGGGC